MKKLILAGLLCGLSSTVVLAQPGTKALNKSSSCADLKLWLSHDLATLTGDIGSASGELVSSLVTKKDVDAALAKNKVDALKDLVEYNNQSVIAATNDLSQAGDHLVLLIGLIKQCEKK